MKTQKEVIEFLKEFWKLKSFDFEAQYNINPKSGKGNFWDIKNPKTKENLLHPETQQQLKVGAPDGFDFELGKYYKIRLFVPSDTIREKFGNEYLLFVDNKNSVPEEIKLTPFEFVQQINTEYSSAIGIAKDTLAGAVKRISYDINRKPETFIFELLQNADDYPDIAKGKVNIRFVLTNNFLIVSHNGLPFSPANVKAICSVDAGNKQFDMNKTGYKGIGFKSIFKFSNYVIVNSGGYTFRFDEFYHKKRGNDTFWQLIPIWTKSEELPEVYNHPQFTSPNVSFCIRPSKSSVTLEDIQVVFKEIFRDERVLLFLRHVTSIDFSGLNDEHFTHAVSKSKWEVSDFLEVSVDEKIREIINRQIKEQDGRVPDKFQDIQTSTIRFATSISEGKIIPSEDTRVFAYLPTDVNLGLPFLINGDFIPDGSRQSIHMDLEWNQYLFEEAGKQFALWLESLYSNYQTPDFLKLIPDFGRLISISPDRDKKLFLEKFKSGFEQMLSEVAFLPDLDGNPQKIRDLTVDHSGLLSLLGEDGFRTYLFIEGPILSPTFANSPDIKILLDEYEFGEVLTHNSISSLLENEEFAEYLLNPDHNSAFISFLNEQGILGDYSGQAIFLSKDGVLKCEDEVYLSLGEDAALLDWLDIPVLNDHLNKLDFLKTVVKIYSPATFIKKEILGSSTAKTNAIVYQNNRKLFQLLFKHHENLPEKEFFGADQFRTFPVFDRETELIADFNSSSLYLYDTEINELMDNHALPESLVTIIDPKRYFSDEVSTETFWTKLGVIEWSEECALPLANKIFSSSIVIQKHLRENPDFLAGNKKLWQFIYKTLSKEAGENEKTYKEKASKLPVFTSDSEVKSLNDCYLSADYTGTNSLETLHENHPEIEIHFVSKDYIQDDKTSDWVSLFRKFGVKTDAKDFIGQYILPEIESVSEDDLVSYTQLIFQNRVHFKEEIAKIKIKVKTEAGIFVEPEEAIIGSYYSKESQDDKVLLTISIENLISREYGDHSLSNWTEFFESLGAKVLKTKEEAIQYKLDEYTSSEKDQKSPWEEHKVIIEELFNLQSSKELTKDHLDSLNHLLLFTKTDTKSAAWNHLFFPSVYNPKIDFEKIINSESLENRFVSPRYLEINPEIKSFLKEIGVFQNFRIFKSEKRKRPRIPVPFLNYLETKFPYIKSNFQQGYGEQHRVEPYIDLDLLEFIGNHEFNKNFWESFSKNDFIQTSVVAKIKYSCAYNSFESENLILWTIQNQNSIPCQDGKSRKPGEVYSFKFNELLQDKSLLPAIDLSEIIIHGQSVEKLLDINTEIDLTACLSIFKEKPSVFSLKKSNIWQTFIKILETPNLTPKETETLNDFLQNGSLPNQLSEWKPISELYYVDQSIDIGITKAPNLIHDDLKKIADKFKITALTSEDFKPQLKNLASERFKDILLSRLKFLALLESPEELEAKESTLKSILDPMKFHKANKIELACDKTNPPIVNSEKQFLTLEFEIYYLRGWNSPYSDELFKYLKKVLDLKKVSEKTLKDILIWSESELFELFDEKHIAYPAEWNPAQKSSGEDFGEEVIEDEDIENGRDHGGSMDYGRNNPKESNQTGNAESRNTSNGKSSHSESVVTNHRESNLTETERAELESLLGRSMSAAEMADSWFNAFIRAIHYYELQGFDLTNIKSNMDNSIRKRMMDNIRNQSTGETKTVLVRSANTGLLRLKYNAWFDLQMYNIELFVTTGNTVGQFKIYKDQSELANETKDSLVMRLDGMDKYFEIESLLQGEYSSEEKKYSPFELFFRIPGYTAFQSIFEGIYSKENKKSITELD